MFISQAKSVVVRMAEDAPVNQCVLRTQVNYHYSRLYVYASKITQMLHWITITCHNLSGGVTYTGTFLQLH